jgi:hypothetical protein
MFTLVRGPTLAMTLTRYLFRPRIPTPACRSTHCQRPRRSIDGATTSLPLSLLLQSGESNDRSGDALALRAFVSLPMGCVRKNIPTR